MPPPPPLAAPPNYAAAGFFLRLQAGSRLSWGARGLGFFWGGAGKKLQPSKQRAEQGWDRAYKICRPDFPKEKGIYCAAGDVCAHGEGRVLLLAPSPSPGLHHLQPFFPRLIPTTAFTSATAGASQADVWRQGSFPRTDTFLLGVVGFFFNKRIFNLSVCS